MFLFVLCLLCSLGATSGIYFGLGLYHDWWWFWVFLVGVPGLSLFTFFLYIVFLVVVGKMFSKTKEYHSTNRFILFMVQQTCWMVVLFLHIHIHDNGLYKSLPDEPFLLISNHLSNFDQIVFLAKVRPSKHPLICITKEENFHFPIIGPWIKKAGYLSIDRENPIKAKKALEEAIERMGKEKVSIYVCPEGTRSKDHHLHEFKVAPFSIASETGCPLVKMAIRDTYLVAYNALKRKTRVFFDHLGTIQGEETKGANPATLSAQCHEELMRFFVSKGVEA